MNLALAPWWAVGIDASTHAAVTGRRGTVSRKPPDSAAVIGREVLTATDVEHRFGLPGGDIFHGAMSLDQLWINRPPMGYMAYCGPIRGLYHCGAGAHPKAVASAAFRDATRHAKLCEISAEGRGDRRYRMADVAKRGALASDV